MKYYKVTCLPILNAKNSGTAIYKSEDGEDCYFVKHIAGDDPGDWSPKFRKSEAEISSYITITEINEQDVFIEVL